LHESWVAFEGRFGGVRCRSSRAVCGQMMRRQALAYPSSTGRQGGALEVNLGAALSSARVV